MQTNHITRRMVVGAVAVLAGFVAWAIADRHSVADDALPTADVVAREWRHPDAPANRYRISLDRSRVVGDIFLVNKPYKDVWEFYAKKCGHVQSMPSVPVMSTGNRQHLILHADRTANGETTQTSSFTYPTAQNITTVTLASRSDGVEVFLSVVTR